MLALFLLRMLPVLMEPPLQHLPLQSWEVDCLCRSKLDFRDSAAGLELGDSEVAGKVSSASYRIVNLDLLSFLFSLISCETCGHELDVTKDRTGSAPTFSFCCGSRGNNVSKSISYAANVGLELGDSEVAGKLSSASYMTVNLDLLSFLFSLICCETCGHELDVTKDRRTGSAQTFSFCCGSRGNNVSKSTSYAANVGLELGDSEVAGKLSSASYRIVNLDLLSFLFSLICCETWGHELGVTEDRMGLVTFSFCCASCGNNFSKPTFFAANVGLQFGDS